MTEKRPVGRPSEYKPAYCNELISLMSEGLSLTAAMGELGFTRNTAHLWADAHPEFMGAIALGQAKRSAFLERLGMSPGTTGPQSTYVSKALPNCNPDDFREKREVEHSGKMSISWEA